ncbi:MAG: hypothetical protein R3F43_19695 [bacterium]
MARQLNVDFPNHMNDIWLTEATAYAAGQFTWAETGCPDLDSPLARD